MKKINIAELLKDCPKGMELDSPVWDNIVFDKVYGNNIIIFRKCCNSKVYLSPYGELHDIDGKCIIFPKGKTTWEGFHRPFTPGDIVITDNNKHAFIYSGENDNYWECYCGVYCGTRDICVNSHVWSDKRHNIRLATEEEKEKLFQVIKDNGYKWNAETKILEKLTKPIFKVGNKIKHKTHTSQENVVTEIRNTHYILDDMFALSFTFQNEYELIPDKFDINTLKPFDKVLVRDHDKGCWDIQFYELYDNTNVSYPYRTLGGMIYKQCIPYKGNEDLVGLIKDCDDYYKTWINEED